MGNLFRGFGLPELIIILVVVIIIFGAGKLPEIGTGIGKAIKGFKTSVKSEDEEKLSTTGEVKKYEGEVTKVS